MTRAGTGVVRSARAAVAVLAVLGTTAAAHQLGGGEAPAPLALLVLAVLVGPPTWLALGRRLTAPALVALLAAGQAAVHVGLTAMAPGHAEIGAAHLHDALPAGLGTGSSGMAPMAGSGPRMLLAHVVATLVLAVVLSRVEAVLWHVVSSMLPRVVAPLRRPLLVRSTPAEVAARPAGRCPLPLGGRAPPLVLA